MERNEAEALLSAHFSAWEHMSSEEKNIMLNSTALHRYKKGASVHGRGNDCVGVLLLKSGMLRSYLLSEDGRQITLYRLGVGDLCVLSASCVLSAITFDVHIDAEQDSEALVVSAAAFSTLTSQNIYVECFAYRLATDRFSEVMWAMQQILFMSMDKRLAVFLWDEASKTGEDVLHLTHEQIARYMGSAREVVTRMLNYFASEGIVELARGGVHIVDKKKLRTLIQP